jgi:hypothetical protein
MENSNCGIAASADPAGRAGKIRYDIEMKSKFHFFCAALQFGRGTRS